MALIQCPECLKQISDQAEACPNCGYPIKKATLEQNTVVESKDSASDLFVVETTETTDEDNNRKKNIIGAVILGVIILIIIYYNFIGMPYLVGKTVDEAVEILKERDITYQIDYFYAEDDDEFDVIVYQDVMPFMPVGNKVCLEATYEESEEIVAAEIDEPTEEVVESEKIPDLIYATKEDSVNKLQSLGMNVEIEELCLMDEQQLENRVGKVYLQSPTSGTTLREGSTVKLGVACNRIPIDITRFNFWLNSASGMEMEIDLKNNSGKNIKYITFYIEAFNGVGDAVYCDIRNTNKAQLQYTGELVAGDKDSCYWEPVLYNSTIKVVRINDILIEYMDGTKDKVIGGMYYYEANDNITPPNTDITTYDFSLD